MKIDIVYVGLRHFPLSKIGWWAWYYKPYGLIKGFNLRICGVHFNIRESDGTRKMIEIHKAKNK